MRIKNIIIYSSFLVLLTSCNENKIETNYIKNIYKIDNEIKYFNVNESTKSFSSLKDSLEYKEFQSFSVTETNELINKLFKSASFYEIPPHEGYNRKWFGFINGNNCMIFGFDNYMVSSDFFDNSYFFGVTTFVNGTKYTSSYGVFNDKELYNKINNYYDDASKKQKGNSYYLGDVNTPFYNVFQNNN